MKKLLAAVLLIATLFVLPQPASATILFAGTEDIDFTCTGTCAISTSGNPFRTAWSREVYSSTTVNPVTDPPTNRFASPTFTGNSAIWIHWQYCDSNAGCGANGASNANLLNAQGLRIFDNVGNPTLIVRGTGTAGSLKISSRTSGGVFTDLVTCASAFDTALTQLDLFINYGASGEVTFYKNSVQTCTFLGDVTNGDGGTTLNQVEFANLSATGGHINATSEVIVATTDTRSMGYLTIEPSASGNATAWSGTNPCSAILNVTAYNDGSYVSSTADNQLEQCTVKFGNGNAGLPAGTYRVETLKQAGRLLRGSTGSQNFNFVTRTASTDYTSTDTALTNSFSNYSYYQATNPNTSNPWDPTDLTAVGFNIGLKSRP